MKRNGTQADYDAAFSAGYVAGARAYARSPGTVSAADGKRAYVRVSRKYGSDWVTGYAAAIDVARGATGMPGASRAAALGLSAKRNSAKWRAVMGRPLMWVLSTEHGRAVITKNSMYEFKVECMPSDGRPKSTTTAARLVDAQAIAENSLQRKNPKRVRAARGRVADDTVGNWFINVIGFPPGGAPAVGGRSYILSNKPFSAARAKAEREAIEEGYTKGNWRYEVHVYDEDDTNRDGPVLRVRTSKRKTADHARAAKLARKNPDPKAVSAVILQQLGGAGKVNAMLGRPTLLYGTGTEGPYLSVKFASPHRGPNYCKITLRGDDTYKVDFAKVGKSGIKPAGSYTGIYAEQLKPLFERVTGLYLSLGTAGKRNPVAKRPTFAAAQAAILDALAADGWTVVRGLKVPHATKGPVRLWFKPQAVYKEKLGINYWKERFDFHAARSLHVPDIRDISPAKFAAYAETL